MVSTSVAVVNIFRLSFNSHHLSLNLNPHLRAPKNRRVHVQSSSFLLVVVGHADVCHVAVLVVVSVERPVRAHLAHVTVLYLLHSNRAVLETHQHVLPVLTVYVGAKL